MEKSLSIKSAEVDGKEFFRRWVLILRPYHNLAPKQMEVVSLLLYKRYILSKEITNKDLLDNLFFEEIKYEIKKEMNYENNQMFSNMLNTLRKSGVLSKDNKILKGLIPNVVGNNFKLIFNFNIKWD